MLYLVHSDIQSKAMIEYVDQNKVDVLTSTGAA